MRTFGAVTVLVSDVIDRVLLASDGVDIGVASSHDQRLVLQALVHDLSTFLPGFAVGQFIAVAVASDSDVVQWLFLHNDDLLLVVLMEWVGRLELLSRLELLRLLELLLLLLVVQLWSGEGCSHKGGKNDEL